MFIFTLFQVFATKLLHTFSCTLPPRAHSTASQYSNKTFAPLCSRVQPKRCLFSGIENPSPFRCLWKSAKWCFSFNGFRLDETFALPHICHLSPRNARRRRQRRTWPLGPNLQFPSVRPTCCCFFFFGFLLVLFPLLLILFVLHFLLSFLERAPRIISELLRERLVGRHQEVIKDRSGFHLRKRTSPKFILQF